MKAEMNNETTHHKWSINQAGVIRLTGRTWMDKLIKFFGFVREAPRC